MVERNISRFIKQNFKHFNAGALVDAADAYVALLAKGGKMFLSMAGAMSTGELGISLAEMIRQNKIHAISCTGANLEEDLFNLVGHADYKRVPGFKDLTPKDEHQIFTKEKYRVTDTIVTEKAMLDVEALVHPYWVAADKAGQRRFPHEFLYEVIRSGKLKSKYQTDPANSWLIAACDKNLPIFVPGWEDSTLGNTFAARVIEGELKPTTIKSGIEYMTALVKWYEGAAGMKPSIGFFQIGGGIAGDFSICVVPLIQLDLKKKAPLWAYFCQISDSTTSYGSYSGAVPNEKITWGKLGPDTPSFVIESDATIVAPLIFAYVLDVPPTPPKIVTQVLAKPIPKPKMAGSLTEMLLRK